MIFIDRADAGRQLAARLRHLYNRDVVVLGLPRGGVPVAAKVAEQLGAQLDVLLVRKLGVPFQPELAMGAVGEGGILILDHHTIRRARVTEAQLVAAQERERAELQRRINRYRPGRLAVALAGRTAVIVDDGLATGSTAQAACQVARAHNAQHVVLAVPVAPLGWERRFPAVADDLVCVASPQPFSSIGCSYHDFRQISDPEVLACLHRAREEHQPD
jgi:putative phosphoribosyl transferase